MQTIDFSHSFLTFGLDSQKKPAVTVTHRPVVTLNRSRKPIDCCLTVEDLQQHRSEQFLLVPSCKTEVLGVAQGLWTQPNADFVAVFSKERFLNLKTYAFVGQEKEVRFYPPSRGSQPDRQQGLVAEAFDHLQVQLASVEAQALMTHQDIYGAVLANKPLVGRTQIEQYNYQAILEYPIKTVNVGSREQFYQTDTGPVLLPDFTRDFEDLIGGLELAYCAFNDPDYIEFIVRVPTEVGPGRSVYHYSKTLSYRGRNQLLLPVSNL